MVGPRVGFALDLSINAKKWIQINLGLYWNEVWRFGYGVFGEGRREEEEKMMGKEREEDTVKETERACSKKKKNYIYTYI